MRDCRTVRWYALLILPLIGAAAPAAEKPIALWGRWEGTFTAAKAAGSRTELNVELTAPSGKKHTVAGFWDGGSTWRGRFMPNEKGAWRWRSMSRPPVAGLDGQSGTFTCEAPRDGNRLLRHGPVRVARAGTHLEHADGTPFFWLGDTAWTGPAMSTAADWQSYLKDRAARRFSGIQFNTLCPWRTAATDHEGRTAFTRKKAIAINPAFFWQLDERIDAVNAHGLVAMPVLVWAHKKGDPGFDLPEDDIVRLVRYQVARYGAHHVVWCLAGDSSYRGETSERWKRIGRAVFGDTTTAPVTTHPTGQNWPWEDWRSEKWLTLLGYQSGHGDGAAALRWIHSGPVKANWHRKPTRPIINLEPPYEDHNGYQSRKPHPAANVRRAVYWSLLTAPPAGVSYGAHGVWSWQTVEGQVPPDHPGTGIAKTWKQALALPGNDHMKHMATLFTALPWWRLRPDEGLLKQPGAKDPARFVAAARSEGGDVAVLYLPVGGTVELNGKRLADGVKAEWFDPRTGKRTEARGEKHTYTAPDGQDWVLVLRKKET